MKKVISLFTGAGGLDLGLEAAGFSTAVAIENNPTACKTLRANQKDRYGSILERDIHDVSSSEICSSGNIKPGEASLLVGGPPCQPFSKSAYWVGGDTRRLNDPRADTLTAYLRVLRDLQPEAFLLENVFGITYKDKDEALKLLQQTVSSINKEVGTNYSFTWKVINCADYGVPQLRERFFLIGLRDGRSFDFPTATHHESSAPGLWSKNLHSWRTAWDAIGDLVDEPVTGLQVTGKWADLLPSIPEGQNYLYHTSRGGGRPLFGWRTRYWTFLLKLSKSRPSWTIQAQPGAGVGPFHWKNRRLSVKELLRIQTFPDHYQIQGGHTEAQRQLGNAVPALITEVLGRAILEQLTGKINTNPLKLLPPHRLPLPAPEPVMDVPKTFLTLEGNHQAHPGEGLGPKSTSATVATT